MKLRFTARLVTVICVTGLGITFAAPPGFVEITSVDTDFATREINIHGSNFDNGVMPVVTLGGFPVTGIKWVDDHIKGYFPAPPLITDGDYLLVVSTGNGKNHKASLSLTLGEVGPQGEPGTDGAPGPKGDKGDTGLTGSQGSQGIQGEQGIQGPPGDNGLNGATGQPGDKGDTGDQGPPGPEGPQGPPGVLAEVQCPTGEFVVGFDAAGALICQSFIPNPEAVTVDFPMVCSNNVTADLSELLFQFTVDPSVIQSNQPFSADISVAMVMPQEFLQAAVNTIPGITSFEVTAAQSTVTVQSGATGADLTIAAVTPLTVPIPLDPGDPTVVVGDAYVPLPLATGSYVADPSGTVLFDFSRAGDDPPVTVIVSDPPGPIGLRALFVVLQIGLECEGGTVVDGAFVPNPVTDPPLISFSIQ